MKGGKQMKRTPLLILALALCTFAGLIALNGGKRAEGAFGFGSRKTTAQPEPEKPLPARWVRLALDEDDSKAILLNFEASKGTTTGYDVAYVQDPSAGNPDEKKKVEAKVTRQPTRTVCNFADLALSDEQMADGTSCTISLGLCTCRERNQEIFCVTAKKVAAQGATRWQAVSTVRATPANSVEKAPLVRLNRKPELTITTKPDLEKKGNLGIALTLARGEGTTEFRKGKTGVDATVVLKTPEGKEVHKDTQPVDKFAFG